ncbi:MAG: CoA transferase [Acidimicrobiales bacterium]
MGGRSVGGRPARRLGRRRGQGGGARRRPHAAGVQPHRRPRPAGVATVRPRQPRQAIGRARPLRRRGARHVAPAAVPSRRVRHQPPTRRHRAARPRLRRGRRAPSPPGVRQRDGLRAGGARCRPAGLRRRRVLGPQRRGVAAGAPGEAPPAIRGGFGDHVTGITTVAGILAALLERSRTGRGGLVETSLLRTGIYCLGWDLGIQARFGKLIPAVPRTEELNPMVNCYRAGDGRWFWLIGVEADRHFPNLCRALAREDLLDDERFATARGRRKNSELVVTTLDAELERYDRDELTARFDEHDVWWAPLNTPADVLADPQARAAGAFVEVPEGAWAPAHQAVASPVRFRHEDLPTPRPAPALGEHTDEVLREAGIDDAAIARLRAAGALG